MAILKDKLLLTDIRRDSFEMRRKLRKEIAGKKPEMKGNRFRKLFNAAEVGAHPCDTPTFSAIAHAVQTVAGSNRALRLLSGHLSAATCLQDGYNARETRLN
ncbi:hypothetical protein PoB_003646300 [Plakobranchus ocellatus]|uniref:Uncharacterized protein n=1 Tax=Plakobranchus ocellatus TaxID=259542 RepID=A0AAV4ATT7_9GAST|nr:hypothetical protein PoB_003646300 [Plakobranchus ocellatus]